MESQKKLHVAYQLTDKIIPYANNPRTHSDRQITQVASSIQEFGFNNPILIDEENGIIAGHGRLAAAKKLNMESVPTIRLEGLTEAQRKAYLIADNKLTENSDWDYDLLAVEVERLKELDFDVDLTGFDATELDALITPTVFKGLTDEDEVPEPPEEPITKEGNIWILGNHRLICGDATNPDNWDLLKIEDGSVVFSSPPYNLGDSIKLSGNKSLNKAKSAYSTYRDNATDSEYISLIEGALSCGMIYCNVVALNLQPLAKSKRPLMKFLADHSSHLIDIITWDKGHAAPVIAEGVMSSRYEWIFLFSTEDNASRSIPYASWRGKWSNVYTASGQKRNEFSRIHGATFPVHLPEFICGDLMNRCRSVVDCFAGTGTTMIAAEKLGKSSYSIEIDPKYCDVIVKRWQDFTGKTAYLEKQTGKHDG